MADCVNVPDPFFRMNDPVVPFEIRFVADDFLGFCPARRLIVRMKSLKEFLESRWRASGIEPQHAVAHLRQPARQRSSMREMGYRRMVRFFRSILAVLLRERMLAATARL